MLNKCSTAVLQVPPSIGSSTHTHHVDMCNNWFLHYGRIVASCNVNQVWRSASCNACRAVMQISGTDISVAVSRSSRACRRFPGDVERHPHFGRLEQLHTRKHSSQIQWLYFWKGPFLSPNSSRHHRLICLRFTMLPEDPISPLAYLENSIFGAAWRRFQTMEGCQVDIKPVCMWPQDLSIHTLRKLGIILFVMKVN